MAWWKGKLLQDLIALASGEAVSKLAGFFAFAYLARKLGPEGYGIVELAVALSVFFAMAIDFGYGSIGAREAAKNRENAESCVRQIVSARLILALFAIPLMGVVGMYTSQSENSSKLIWLFSLGLLAIPWKHNWLMQGLEKMNLVALGQVIRMLVFTLGVFIFVNSIEDILTVGYIEIFAATCMAISYLIMQMIHVGRPRFDFHLGRLIALSKKAISVGLSNVVWSLNQYIPVILISTLNTPTQLALFAAVHRVTSSLVGFSLLYHFNLFPSVSKRINTSPAAFQELAKASTHFTAWGGTAIALFVSLLSEEITVFIFGDSFREASTALAIIIWVLPITLLSGHSRWALIASNRQRYVLYAQSGSSITTILFCLLLIPYYDAVGASVAMVLAALTVWCIAYYFARKYICKIPFLSVFIKPLLFSLVAAIFASQINNVLMGTLAAIITYIILTLIFDQSLLSDVVTLANAKDPQHQRAIKLNFNIIDRSLFFISAVSLIALSIFISNDALLIALSPDITAEHLSKFEQGCVFLKKILFIDGFILVFISFRRQKKIKDSCSLWMSNRKNIMQSKSLFLILLSVIGICTVFSHSFLINTSLWIDELLTTSDYVSLDFAQMLSNFSSDKQYLLYSELARISVGFFGETVFAIRIPILIVGVCSVFAIASLGRYLFGNKTALFSASLLAIFYHHIWFFPGAPAYSFFLFVTIVSTELMLRAMETEKWKFWFYYALLIALFSWVHTLIILISIVHGMVCLGLVIVKGNSSSHQYKYRQSLAGLILAIWFTLHMYAIPLPKIVDLLLTQSSFIFKF